jgi:hypothetical protein
MFQFLALQCIAIAIVMFIPAIAISFPQSLQTDSRAVKTEDVDDSENSLETDPMIQQEEQILEKEEEGTGAPEDKEQAKPKK